MSLDLEKSIVFHRILMLNITRVLCSMLQILNCNLGVFNLIFDLIFLI